VIKNVAGYDVSRLQAGAMGTLGIITEVSLRVFPRPERAITVAREVGYREAIEDMNQWLSRSGTLSGACWTDQRLYLRFSGCGLAVQSQAREAGGDILDQDESFWTGLREQKLPFFAGDKPLWRFSLASGTAFFLPDEQWLIDWGGSQRWLRGNFELADLESRSESSRGQVGLYRGGDRQAEVFHSKNSVQVKIHKNIKQAFDPQGIFNPGRLYSWM
jgi:glycolate oxidase FAD binding subunit